MVDEFVKEIIQSKPVDDSYKYSLLSRMQSDCNYFLGNGNRNEKQLWAGNVKDHIENMKALYNSFSDNGKPEWLTKEQIEDYEKKMMEGRQNGKIKF